MIKLCCHCIDFMILSHSDCLKECANMYEVFMKEKTYYLLGKYVMVKYVVADLPILLKTNYFKFCFYQYSSLFSSLETIKRHCCQFPNCYTFNI